jgi:error-prone DNA polymerase
VAEQVWTVLAAFGSFGFCKAHAAAFALPTYQSAWLKTHHPAAFLAGVLTHDPGMYPKRLILDDARNFGIRVLGLDVNASTGTYRVERIETDPDGVDEGETGTGWRRPEWMPPAMTDPSRHGIRLALADVKGISDDEVARVVAGQPYRSLTDFWHRASVSRPVVERLVLAGGFNSLYGFGVRDREAGRPTHRRKQVTRRDLLLQIGELDRWSRSGARASSSGQLSLNLMGLELPEDGPEETGPTWADSSGLPEFTDAELVRAELEVLGLDASRHVIDFYRPFLAALGAVPAGELLTCRSGAEVLVAGVKVATQTPPIRSGRRVVFVTLDDGSGCTDSTFFEDAQGPYAATLFHSWLLLVRGELRRTGPRGVSLRATGCWELSALHALWQSQGIEAVRHRLAEVPAGFGPEAGQEAVQGAAQSRSTRPVMARPPVDSADPAGASAGEPGGAAGGMGRRRVLVHASGFKVSPYADVRPAGDSTKQAPRKLWHSSPGSPG